MTDRDTFAAAALTGLLTKDDAAKPESMAPWWPEWVCAAAYRWADAMLRERGNHSETPNSSPALTDAEREAVETAMDGYIAWMEDNSALETPPVQLKLATLRKLLERLK